MVQRSAERLSQRTRVQEHRRYRHADECAEVSLPVRPLVGRKPRGRHDLGAGTVHEDHLPHRVVIDLRGKGKTHVQYRAGAGRTFCSSDEQKPDCAETRLHAKTGVGDAIRLPADVFGGRQDEIVNGGNRNRLLSKATMGRMVRGASETAVIREQRRDQDGLMGDETQEPTTMLAVK